MSVADLFKKMFGTKAERDLKQLQPILSKVLDAYAVIDKLSVDELREKSASLRQIIRDRIADDESRIAQIKEELEKIFNCKVDVVSLGAMMRPLFRKNLERDTVFV